MVGRIRRVRICDIRVSCEYFRNGAFFDETWFELEVWEGLFEMEWMWRLLVEKNLG